MSAIICNLSMTEAEPSRAQVHKWSASSIYGRDHYPGFRLTAIAYIEIVEPFDSCISERAKSLWLNILKLSTGTSECHTEWQNTVSLLSDYLKRQLLKL